MGGLIGQRLVHDPRVEAHLGEQVAGHLGPVGLAALDVQCGPGPQVPGIVQRRVGALEQGPDAHHRPAVGPFPFPRMFLALGPVDLLKAEEAPVHVEVEAVADLAHP